MLKLLLLCGLISFSSAAVKLQEMFAWNVLDWAYPDEQSRIMALSSGELVPENALPVGIERWGNKLFVSVPRWRPGIPATLNYIPLDAPYNPSPKLVPYPSWQANELGNCASGLTTVYRIKADRCNRLWVLDVGTYGYDPNVTNVCPFALNVYDLNTDRRIRRYVFRPEDIVASTFIANIALDMGSSCEDTFAYFSDELGYGLIAYSWEQNKSWRFNHGYFMPDPLVGDFNIDGLNFQWYSEGIFGITASPIGPDGFRTLYFSPLTSNTEFAVSTQVLRNESRVSDSYKDFRVVGVRGPNSHTTAHVMSESGVELYNLIDQNAIGCWNSQLPLRPQNTAIVDKDDVGLVFPCDVKIVDESEVWVISDRMSGFLESEFGLDYSDINFRIFTAPLDALLAGTVCEPQPRAVTAAEVVPRTMNFYNPQVNGVVPNPPPSMFLTRQPQMPQQPQQPLQNMFNLQNQQPQQNLFNQPNQQSQQNLFNQPNQQQQNLFNQQNQQNQQNLFNQQNRIPADPQLGTNYNYIEFPVLPAVPLQVGRNANKKQQNSSLMRPWWIRNNYEVYEQSV